MVPARFVVSVFVSVAPLVFRAPEGPAAREARRPHFVRRRASKPARALRTLRRPSRRWCLWFWCARPGPAATHGRCSQALRSLRRPPHWRHLVCWRVARPGPAATHGRGSQAPPRSSPVPSGPFGALRAGGPVVLVCPARPRHRTRAPQPGSLFSPAPSTPAGPVVLVCPARPRRHSRASPLMLTNFARNSPTTVSNLECASLELQRFQRLLKLPSNELRATFLEPAVSYVLHQRIQECSVFRGPTVPRGCAWFGHSWGVRTSL